jgi:hypothetical protein
MGKKSEPLKVGEKFGRLVVTSAPYRKGNNLWVTVLCECGRSKDVQQPSLRSGNTSSCGCLKAEQMSRRFTTHGKTGTRVYHAFVDMVQRTTNPKVNKYSYYGGRGIKVCPAWKTFEGFYRDMGEPPSLDHTLERLDTEGDYSKENCVWATKEEQADNRRSSVRYQFKGELKTLKELAEIAGTTVGAMEHRLRSYSAEIAVSLERYSKKEAHSAGRSPAEVIKLYKD